MPKFRFPIIHSAHHVSFAKFLYRNSPKSEALYSFFGLFCLISTISTIYLTQYEFLRALGNVTLYLYQVMLIISLFFSLYMMLPLSIRHPLVVRVLWCVGLIYNMTFCTTFFLLMSQFHHILLMVCALSLFVIFNLCHWKTACIVITIGVSGALLFYGLQPRHGRRRVAAGWVHRHRSVIGRPAVWRPGWHRHTPRGR